MSQVPVLTLNSRALVKILGAGVLLLLVGHAVGLYLKYGLGYEDLGGLLHFLDIDYERSAANFFSSCLLLVNALLFLIAWASQRTTSRAEKAWLLLSGVFYFLAMDELFAIHERLGEPVRNTLNASGILYFAWFIPYGAGIALLAIIVIPALLRLDGRIRLWFLLAAVMYLAGAIGVEMFEGWYVEAKGWETVEYGLFTGIEEVLEMAGLITLVYAMLSLTGSWGGGFTVAITGIRQASVIPEGNQPMRSGRASIPRLLRYKPQRPITFSSWYSRRSNSRSSGKSGAKHGPSHT